MEVEGMTQPLTRDFADYVDYLAALTDVALSGAGELGEEIRIALDGGPASVLRKAWGRDKRRAAGAFFTGRKLAERLVTSVFGESVPVDEGRLFFDPACGSGDLLLAVARRLPVASDLSVTLRDWGDRLSGYDTCEAFVQVSKYRLCFRGPFKGMQTLKSAFNQSLVPSNTRRRRYVSLETSKSPDLPAPQSTVHPSHASPRLLLDQRQSVSGRCFR